MVSIMRSDQTLRLIQLYHTHFPEIARNNQDNDGRSMKTQMWSQIADELNRAFESQFTVEQYKKKVQNVQCTSRQKLYSGKRNLGEAEVEYLRLFETDKIQPEVLLQRAKSRRSHLYLVDSANSANSMVVVGSIQDTKIKLEDFENMEMPSSNYSDFDDFGNQCGLTIDEEDLTEDNDGSVLSGVGKTASSSTAPPPQPINLTESTGDLFGDVGNVGAPDAEDQSTMQQLLLAMVAANAICQQQQQDEQVDKGKKTVNEGERQCQNKRKTSTIREESKGKRFREEQPLATTSASSGHASLDVAPSIIFDSSEPAAKEQQQQPHWAQQMVQLQRQLLENQRQMLDHFHSQSTSNSTTRDSVSNVVDDDHHHQAHTPPSPPVSSGSSSSGKSGEDPVEQPLGDQKASANENLGPLLKELCGKLDTLNGVLAGIADAIRQQSKQTSTT